MTLSLSLTHFFSPSLILSFIECKALKALKNKSYTGFYIEMRQAEKESFLRKGQNNKWVWEGEGERVGERERENNKFKNDFNFFVVFKGETERIVIFYHFQYFKLDFKLDFFLFFFGDKISWKKGEERNKDFYIGFSSSGRKRERKKNRLFLEFFLFLMFSFILFLFQFS